MIISDMRRRVDEVDIAIVRLLNKRLEMVLDIQKAKLSAGLPSTDLQREFEILNRITTYNSGPMNNDKLQEIFKVILK